MKETWDLPRQQSNTCDMFGQHSAEPDVCHLKMWKKSDQGGLLFWLRGSNFWVEGLSYLFVTLSCTDYHTSYLSNPTSWHHTTETFHLPHSSLYNLCIEAKGFLLDSWTLKLGPMGCPETSVRNYHYSLRSNPEEHSSYLLCGWSLQWCITHK